MNVLFTGASSFTGYWFVKELVEAGHEVTCTFTKDPSEYQGVRKERVEEIRGLCKPLDKVKFGDDKFLEAIKGGKWDLLCHHAAEVGNYRSDEYDIGMVLKNNTNSLGQVLEDLKASGCEHVLLTGSVFEKDEGDGTKPLEPFYLYGLSKHFTHEVFKYMSVQKDMVLGKFVIPNPFGPMEDPKFTTYLIKTWYKGETPEIRTPEYVRDNVHVTLLAKVYVDFAEKLVHSDEELKINPSQYVGKQGDFGELFAKEMGPRLGISCPLGFADQKEFPEPKERYNTDMIDVHKYHWEEEKAWGQLAKFYQEHYS